ncbi:hypothetical protein AVEN_195362-1 [Araneus ventricosus]|uniref:Uncharacterized protein n=1 Tax=Araneus ventricosus TaxID=182803 RepID=A0A4Y2DK64_ARAVE|nr:hypothetical protein AVEN_195362-1 [Araneus ventricosus]
MKALRLNNGTDMERGEKKKGISLIQMRGDLNPWEFPFRPRLYGSGVELEPLLLYRLLFATCSGSPRPPSTPTCTPHSIPDNNRIALGLRAFGKILLLWRTDRCSLSLRKQTNRNSSSFQCFFPASDEI